MKKEFYSNGKLLITGEYLVLDGAKAFALPTKFGQTLIVENAEKKLIHWKSIDADGTIWFEDKITFLSVINKEKISDDTIKNTLIEILHFAYLMKPQFISEAEGYSITTQLTFPKNWGLGTSSTLINNIAQWLNIDAYKLLKNSFGGSGYDIACAQNDSALIYQLVNEKPIVKKVEFNPSFTNKLFFIYLNRKQNSREAIASYLNQKGNVSELISIINNITQKISSSNDINDFTKNLHQHEIELSNVLELQTIQEALFNDFNGVIKSLGAWNGDFVMAISKENPTAYFKEKGFDIIIPYEEMIL